MTHPTTAPRSAGRRARAITALAVVAVAAAGGVASTSTASADDAVPLLTSDATTWRYLDDGADPAGSGAPLSWTTASYDDSAWGAAQGSFGAKNGSTTGMGGGYAVDTLLEQRLAGSTDDVPTYFFRTSFDLTAEQISGWGSLEAEVVYDDALVVYVNGTKAVGYEDGRVVGNVGYAGDGGGDPDRSTFSVDPALLVPGENTVSVALHQDRATSSDIYFDFLSLTPVSASAPTTISDVVLTVGADESERGLAWYSDSGTAEEAQVAPSSQVTAAGFPATASSFPSASGPATSGDTWHHATITGLAPSTSYSYRVGSDADGWSPTYVVETQAAGDYGFLFVGDAQIGASGDAASDTEGWVRTMDTAAAAFPDTSFVLSAGDQVNTASNEAQYDGFLAPTQTKTLPFATNIGNHDVASVAYEQHFALPNVDLAYGKPSADRAGGDYWFVNGDTLFISLNSNDKDDARHAEFAARVIAEHGADARWRVVTFHHSVYSVASHATDADIVTRRAELPPAMSALDVDVVLMGHDHVYVRSYLMEGTTPVGADGAVGSSVVAEDGQVLYVTANSSSGSKYYDIQPIDFDFDAVANQEYTPNFTNVQVSGDSIEMTTYRTRDMTVVDSVTLERPAEPVPPVDPTVPPVEPTVPPVEPTVPPVDPGAPGEPGAPGGGEPTAVPLDELTESTRTLVVEALDEAAATVTVRVPRALAGSPLDWFVHSEPVYLGDDPSDDDGVLTLQLPEGLGAGTHTLVAQTGAGEVATWGTVDLTAASDPVAVEPGAGAGAGAGGGAGAAGGGALAFTGGDVLPVAAASILVLLAGLGLVLRSRRRRA